MLAEPQCGPEQADRPGAAMRRITLWLFSTIAALVLLFSYRTSTDSLDTAAAAVRATEPAAVTAVRARRRPPRLSTARLVTTGRPQPTGGAHPGRLIRQNG